MRLDEHVHAPQNRRCSVLTERMVHMIPCLVASFLLASPFIGVHLHLSLAQLWASCSSMAL